MLYQNDNNFDSCVIAAEQHQATAACSQLPFFYYSPHFRMFFLRAALPFFGDYGHFFASETFTSKCILLDVCNAF